MKFLPVATLGIALVAPAFAYASDEYKFDLTKPAPYAKAWFAIAAEDRDHQRAGPAEAFKKSRAYDLRRKMEPKPESPVEQWAAYYFTRQQCALARIPDADYLERLRKTTESAESVRLAFHIWNYGGLMRDVSMSVGSWRIYSPSVEPTTKPEEIKRLHRYMVRLGAQILAELNARYLPDWRKRFDHFRTREDDPWSDKPPVRTPAQQEALRKIRVEEEWKEGMRRIHSDFDSELYTMKANLCALFRRYLPGDKASIREMLVVAGYKTSEQRKAYWQFCRTVGANWADWTPADEQRLVTD